MCLKKMLWMFLLLLTACSGPVDTNVAEQAVPKFHEMLDAERFQSIYDQSTDDLKKAASQKDFVEVLIAIHRKLGATKSFSLQSKSVNYSPFVTLVTLSYTTIYAEGEATEQFEYRLQEEKAVLNGYHITSNALMVK